MPLKRKRSISVLLVIQGIFFLLTGLWPILHIDSFLRVTGPKEEVWLVKTLGMLIASVGIGFFTAGLWKTYGWPLILIAIVSAAGFVVVDVYYVLQKVIPPVYLLDGFAELLFLIAWIIILFRMGSGVSGPSGKV